MRCRDAHTLAQRAAAVAVAASCLVAGLAACAAEGDAGSRDGTSRAGGAGTAGDTGAGSASDGSGDASASSTGDGAGDGSDFGNAAAGSAAPAPTTVVNAGGNDCAPGHYLGHLEGEYFAQVWGNGGVAIPFATGEINGQPGMEFWLERTERECSDAEFCADFEIRGGKLRGWAIPNADASMMTMMGGFGARFEMEISGELDCSTGEFRGRLENACYDVLGTLYRMEGTLDASYDKASDAFVTGEWALIEMPLPGALIPPDANIGGTGGWGAMLADDGTSPIADGEGLCDKASGFDTAL